MIYPERIKTSHEKSAYRHMFQRLVWEALITAENSNGKRDDGQWKAVPVQAVVSCMGEPERRDLNDYKAFRSNVMGALRALENQGHAVSSGFGRGKQRTWNTSRANLENEIVIERSAEQYIQSQGGRVAMVEEVVRKLGDIETSRDFLTRIRLMRRYL